MGRLEDDIGHIYHEGEWTMGRDSVTRTTYPPAPQPPVELANKCALSPVVVLIFQIMLLSGTAVTFMTLPIRNVYTAAVSLSTLSYSVVLLHICLISDVLTSLYN